MAGGPAPPAGQRFDHLQTASPRSGDVVRWYPWRQWRVVGDQHSHERPAVSDRDLTHGPGVVDGVAARSRSWQARPHSLPATGFPSGCLLTCRQRLSAMLRAPPAPRVTRRSRRSATATAPVPATDIEETLSALTPTRWMNQRTASSFACGCSAPSRASGYPWILSCEKNSARPMPNREAAATRWSSRPDLDIAYQMFLLKMGSCAPLWSANVSKACRATRSLPALRRDALAARVSHGDDVEPAQLFVELPTGFWSAPVTTADPEPSRIRS